MPIEGKKLNWALFHIVIYLFSYLEQHFRPESLNPNQGRVSMKHTFILHLVHNEPSHTDTTKKKKVRHHPLFCFLSITQPIFCYDSCKITPSFKPLLSAQVYIFLCLLHTSIYTHPATLASSEEPSFHISQDVSSYFFHSSLESGWHWPVTSSTSLHPQCHSFPFSPNLSSDSFLSQISREDWVDHTPLIIYQHAVLIQVL